MALERSNNFRETKKLCSVRKQPLVYCSECAKNIERLDRMLESDKKETD